MPPRAISVWHCLTFDLNNNISVVPVQSSGVGTALTQLVQIYEKLVQVFSQNVLLSSGVKRTAAWKNEKNRKGGRKLRRYVNFFSDIINQGNVLAIHGIFSIGVGENRG
jgi:hypothetical protein